MSKKVHYVIDERPLSERTFALDPLLRVVPRTTGARRGHDKHEARGDDYTEDTHENSFDVLNATIRPTKNQAAITLHPKNTHNGYSEIVIPPNLS